MTDEKLQEYAHLWDGSEAGWVIHRTYVERAEVIALFAGDEPTAAELAKLRALDEGWGALSATEALSRARGRREISLGVMAGREARALEAKADELALAVRVEGRSTVHHMPHNEQTHVALLIEDDALAERVCAEAMRRGVPVREIES